jgi:hypothetical protein
VTDACFVSWPLRVDAVDGLRATVARELDGADGSGVAELLPESGVSTTSVFIYQDHRPKLVWYVEHDGGDAWAEPAAAVRDASPLFPTLADHCDSRPATVVADLDPDAVEVVHASLPDRPNAYADRSGGLPTVLSGNDADAGVPDVVPLRLAIRPGLGSLLARVGAGLVDRTPDWLEAKFEAASHDVMADEGMYTETLLLERTPDGYDLWWYMESGGMAQVYEAYYESSSRIARVSEHVLGWVLERPERVLAHPVEASDFELLAHAVDAKRE